jgi:hypothetical protein
VLGTDELNYAALGGSPTSMKYLNEKGCEGNSCTCENAATGGNLQCLVYRSKLFTYFLKQSMFL